MLSQSNGGWNGSRIVNPPSAASRSARRRRRRSSRGQARNTSRMSRLNWRRLPNPDANATSAKVSSESSRSRRAKWARRDRASWSGGQAKVVIEQAPQVARRDREAGPEGRLGALVQGAVDDELHCAAHELWCVRPDRTCDPIRAAAQAGAKTRRLGRGRQFERADALRKRPRTAPGPAVDRGRHHRRERRHVSQV